MNSELDRRSGGRNLFRFLKENFEDKGKPYHLVGHSHGGSVIAEALRYSVFQKSQLKNLQSWISVATPFLAFQKQKRLFQRVKRRYQLLIATLLAYVMAVLLAVPIGMCATGVGAAGECWVEKSHIKYMDFASVNEAYVELSQEENQQLHTFGGEDAQYINPDARKSDENRNTADENITTYVKTIAFNLIPKSVKESLETGLGDENYSGAFRLDITSTNFDQPEQVSENIFLRVNDIPSSESLFEDSRFLADTIKKLAQMRHNEEGQFPLNVCAPNNLELFILTNTDIYANDYTLVTDTALQEFDEKSYTPNSADLDTDVTETILFRQYVYDFGLERLKELCANKQNDQELDNNVFNWARNMGFKESKSLTLRALYFTGKPRMFRLDFRTMGEMKITPFIPRSEVIFSPGFLMYLGFNSLPVLFAFYLLWRAQKYLRRRYGQAGDDQFSNWYQGRWIKLSHPEDEAINSISASTKAELKIAPPDMLQGMFMLAFSTIMAIVLMFNGVKLINWIWSGNPFGFKRELVEELGYAINKAHGVLDGTGSFAGTNLTGWKSEMPMTVFFNNDGGLSILSLVIVFGIILIGFIFLGRMAEKYILNPILRKGIDGIAQGSAASGAFGDDSLGEMALQCQSYPSEFEDPYRGEFPQPVQKAIEDYANQDLVLLPGKFRAALYKNVSKTDNFSLSDLLEGDLGEILLHTSYFNVEEFHDLFAAALTSTGDFAPSPRFKTYKTAAQWFAGIKGTR